MPTSAVERFVRGEVLPGRRFRVDVAFQCARLRVDGAGCARANKTYRVRVGASFARSRAARTRGFSLLEILVVMVILAVAVGAVSLAIAGAGGERVLTREAERTQALFEFACERAQLSGRDIGISLSQGGFRFSHLDAGVWLPYREEALRARSWPASLSAVLARDEQVVQLEKGFPERPQLLCYASGELTAFRLELALPDLAKHYRLDGQGDGQVRLSAFDAHAR